MSPKKSIGILVPLGIVAVAALVAVQYAREPRTPGSSSPFPFHHVSTTNTQSPPPQDAQNGGSPQGKPLGKDSEGREIIGKRILGAMATRPEDAGELGKMIQGGRAVPDPNAVNDFIALLDSSEPQVRFLGAIGLRKLANPASKDALVAFLKRMDFTHTEGRYTKTPINYMYDLQSMGLAILTLGDVGDKSVIRTLKSLENVDGLGEPVMRALVELGAIDSLSKIPESAEPGKKNAAAEAISRLRDPKDVPGLMATARDEDCAKQVRTSAIYALGQIDDPSVDEFLVTIMNDEEAGISMRAASIAAISGSSRASVVSAVLPYTKNGQDNVLRCEAVVDLATHWPEKHMAMFIAHLTSSDEDPHYREILSQRLSRFSGGDLRKYRNDIYACLHAVSKNDKPLDEVRVNAWVIVYRFFGEERPLELSKEGISSETPTVKWILYSEIALANPEISYRNLEAQIEQRLSKIVTECRPTREE